MKELSQGWIDAALEECALFNPKHSLELPGSTSVSFVPMPAVSDISGEIEVPEVRRLDEVWKGYTHFQTGDVIFAKITPCMENGKIAVARSLTNSLACGSTEFHVLRPHNGVSADFLWRFLRQKSFRAEAEHSMTGAVGQRRVPADFLKKTIIPLPPVPEQGRIVAKIESLSAKSRRARDQLDHIPRLVEKYKQAILAAAFSGKLMPALISKTINEDVVRDHTCELASELKVKPWKTETINWEGLHILPEGWNWMKVGDVSVHQSGIAFKSETFDKSGVQVIRLGNLYNGRLDLKRSPVFLSSDNAPAGTFRAKENDVLVSLTGTKYKRDYGFFVKVPHSISVFVNQRILCLSCSKSLVPDFLVYFSQTPKFRECFFSMETGGVNQGNVPVAGVMEAPIPVPSVAVQEKMVACIGAMFKWIERLASEATSARKLIDHLDQSVLAKAFRGELVPQDPNDEPASVLLERIKAERTAQPAANRARARKKAS